MSVPVRIKERLLFSKDISDSLIKYLVKQRISGEFCDVTIIVNGRRFFGHKAILAANSPYFRSMFSSRMREESDAEVDMTTSLMLEKCDSFTAVLDYFYIGEIYLDLENCLDILRIADFLLINELKDFVKDFFLKHGHLDISNATYLWNASSQFNEESTNLVAYALLQSRFRDFYSQSSDVFEIPEDIFFRMMNDKQIRKHCTLQECTNLVLEWMRRNVYSGLGIVPFILENDLCSLDIITLEELKFMLRDLRISEALNEVKRTLQTKLVRPAVCSHVKMCNDGRENDRKPILVAINSQIPQRFLKILLFSIDENIWYRSHLKTEKMIHRFPSRLNACSILCKDNRLHMFLGFNVPYPTDMTKIQMFVVDLCSGETWLQTFRHRYNQADSCQTTLIDNNIVPPAICYCNGYLCVVGNMRSTGHLFLCDILTKTYLCYQIPSTRFISLARIATRGDRQIFIWSRHRFGHEEYCVNKEVSFSIFDIRTKSFNAAVIPPPPGIDYNQFTETHMLLEEKGQCVVHSPGANSYVLNETLSLWKVYPKKIVKTPKMKMPVNMPYKGYEVNTFHDGKLFTLDNPAAYITSMVTQSTDGTTNHLLPPPTDGINLLTGGSIEKGFLKKLSRIDQFDEHFTQLMHHRVLPLANYDSETSMSSSGQRCRNHGDDFESGDDLEYDGFVYDEDIFGLYEEY